ncbi:MAG TPA: hypothetical protein VFN74_22315 [Chloroflexota bacterium]|nr:hypothetical protein [Chloroflexota bacterium]
MYSPKIAEHLIPRIYRLAQARRQHMTTLVNEALAKYLADQDVPASGDAEQHDVSGPVSGLAPDVRAHALSTQQAQPAA